MADIKEPQRALPVVGLIYVPGVSLDISGDFKDEIGDISLKSHVIPFRHTTYYQQEMGGELLRQWYAFGVLVSPDMLAELKHKTNRIEKKYVKNSGGRNVNIDPGLVSLSNLILASTKNYAHRIYVGKGIYAEVTLIYREHKFNPLNWTYPDYRETAALEFFSKARDILKAKLAEEKSQLKE